MGMRSRDEVVEAARELACDVAIETMPDSWLYKPDGNLTKRADRLIEGIKAAVLFADAAALAEAMSENYRRAAAPRETISAN